MVNAIVTVENIQNGKKLWKAIGKDCLSFIDDPSNSRAVFYLHVPLHVLPGIIIKCLEHGETKIEAEMEPND